MITVIERGARDAVPIRTLAEKLNLTSFRIPLCYGRQDFDDDRGAPKLI